MSIPKAVFLDTQVFDSANYNFASTALKSFVQLCQERSLTLLLPAPTLGEIQRHMLDRAGAAEEAINKALADVQKKAPFLTGSDRFPRPPKERTRVHVLRRHCDEAWDAFTSQIKTQKLKYDGIQLSTIMMWYELSLAPFGKGKKQKEFPDAIALAILAHYATKSNQFIAVVSDDVDMQKGCERFQSLFHFPSLSSFLEAWLSEDASLDLYINLINASLSDLNVVLTSEIDDFGVFNHYDRRFTRESSRVHEVEVGSFDVIGLGNHECTIAYMAYFTAEHLLSWEDDWPDGSPRKEDDWVSQDYEFGGTAKIRFTADNKSVESCDNIEVDTHDFEISKHPRRMF